MATVTRNFADLVGLIILQSKPPTAAEKISVISANAFIYEVGSLVRRATALIIIDVIITVAIERVKHII